MPGFTIHLAIAKQYMKKHKNEIKDEEEFYKGAIAPDMDENMVDIVKDKDSTHYGVWNYYVYPPVIDCNKFLKDPKVDISKDFWKGYLLHLLSDFYFCNVIFKKENYETFKNKENLYSDYDSLNEEIIKKYNIKIYDNIKKYLGFHNLKTKYLKEEKVIDFIEKISDLDLKDQEQKIEKFGMEELYNEFRS